ncbi:hypothetical protein PPYR_02894 [Photinus pyralis]|uniref:Major facilitator superfamily (MFS) profile domain-containing protein n=2 Tax=Photinus pyralis TaxID=7054 RepID=A0A5N4A190_PHOPY|nr:facilitated trehalose transporter Tret1-like [Photinus pyralis]KAB0791094.1 hypothetical protein PPYR_02894 [Photinus pyralis]
MERVIPKSGRTKIFVQIYAIMAVSVGSFSTGAQFAWPSPSVPQLLLNTSYIGRITMEQASYFSILPPIVVIISSFFIGNAMRFIGREYIMGFLAVPHVVHWIVIANATNLITVYVARAISGVSDAICYSTIAVYVGEITTPHVRGTWGNSMMCAILLGHLSVAAVGAYQDIVTTAYIFTVPPLLYALLIIFIPESPYFLIMTGRNEEAKIALQWLRWQQNVDDEYLVLVKNVQEQVMAPGQFGDLFRDAVNRKALLVNVGLRICQQFSGFSAFVIYVQIIFELATDKSVSAEMSTVIVYSVLFLLSVLATSAITRCGRRTMLTISSVGCSGSLLANAVYFYIADETGANLSQLGWLPLLFMASYMAFLATGLSPLPSLMTGELFATSIKSHAMFVSTIARGVALIIAPKILQLLIGHLPMYFSFTFFTLSCLASAIFCYRCVPETKGKTLQEIQDILRKKSFCQP